MRGRRVHTPPAVSKGIAEGMKRWSKRPGRWFAGLLAAALLLAPCAPALAAQDGPRVLRVAFPQVEGMSETDADGTRHGLLVDYLNEIAKYTDWEYEYVDTTGDIMVSDFIDGKYDLMGGNYYYPGAEQYFAYPEYNTGYSKSVLLARQDDDSIKSYSLESLNGKTIGVYSRAAENIRRLKVFLSSNNLDCALRVYEYEDLSEDDNLYPYLENGDVDLLLGNIGEWGGKFRVVAAYNSQPYYIVTNVGNQEVLDGLNMALEKIADANPNFGEERYAANFPDKLSADVWLNAEERAYVREKGTVTVAVLDAWHPLFCLNTDGDLHHGVVPDILEKISAFSGLEFDYVYAQTYREAVELVQQGQADLLGFFLGGEEDAARQGLALTAPFVGMNSIVVRNKSSNYPDEGLVAATVDNQDLPGGVEAAEVRTYESITQALSAVNRGEADFIYGLSARLEQDVQRYRFSNLVPVALVNDRRDICFALDRPVDVELLTVLNKAIHSLSTEEKEELLSRNLVSIGVGRLTLEELVYANPVAFVATAAAILLVVAASVLLAGRARMRAAVMRSNMEKAQAESRAKGEFLSRMSHEIRTPMNAVVGLADLTDMMEGVPEGVHENLSKLRSSSHYLLSLINDILDMSRIDSGMLSIADEPFSLERVLDDLQGMMDSEAGRRGVRFTLERQITHSALSGDAVRLRQVLTNLLSNAFKFTPEGGAVRLLAAEREVDGERSEFTFRVIDSGVGIQPEDQRRIFESFEQLGANYAKSQGTGLGLPISSNIVKLMGGELGIRSEPGRGSEFYFTIPMALRPEEEEARRPAAGGMLRGARLLLAEDNDLNAEIAVQLLELQGAQVRRCADGREALECFEKSAPGEFHLILMDIQMPRMNGLEAARAIRALPRPDAASVPIVAMTANSFQEDVRAAEEAGMNGFIPKPLDVEYLYRVLRDLLGGAT